MHSDGAELLARAAAGDRGAFEQFVRRWERPLFRFLERTLGSAQMAEDARQITFVRVLERGSTFRGGSASAWIFRVAYRTALDLRRRERLRRTAPIDAETPLADAGPGPGEAAEVREEREFLRAALDALEPEDRAILWLRVADGRTFASVAEALGRPESTVRLRFVRTLGRLRRRLAPAPAAGSGGERWNATRS